MRGWVGRRVDEGCMSWGREWGGGKGRQGREGWRASGAAGREAERLPCGAAAGAARALQLAPRRRGLAGTGPLTRRADHAPLAVVQLARLGDLALPPNGRVDAAQVRQCGGISQPVEHLQGGWD